MTQVEKYKNIKSFLKDLQRSQLDLISDFIIKTDDVNRTELFGKNRNKEYVIARRTIALLARLYYNIQGDLIAEYLNMSKEMISDYIHSGFSELKKNPDYQTKIRQNMVKLNFYHNVNQKPLI